MDGRRDIPVKPALLLNMTPSWAALVHAAAAGLPGVQVEDAATPADAARRLAAGGSRYSHLLLEPRFADGMLDVLTDLSSGEPGSGTSLILVGDEISVPPHASRARTHVVRTPAGDWLAEALGADTVESFANLGIEELRDALSSARIGARYQPIVRMSDFFPRSLEVLARFDHPTRGTLPPDLFVPLMEKAGLGWPLTETVVTRAFEDWGGGKLAATGLALAINFPLDVLLIPGALPWLEANREKAGIPAGKIIVELTESQDIVELLRLGEALGAMRALGYRLAIDDVGPEVRDHRPLLDLPFTALKLDKELVQSSRDSPAALDFLRTAIKAGRRADLIIVAEGITDQGLWDLMEASGVDMAQGYLVGRPLPAEAVHLWVADWRARHPALADQTDL